MSAPYASYYNEQGVWLEMESSELTMNGYLFDF